ncbi:uncharacterized protein LTR77_008848 [Saxophila tyrrhenica]|uniref:Cytochrome b561 domain-containing protein n=1 Tax=Saxophila tyrrhenica TaxID=1690608 RepID=A0AAV9P110_9PEZI|nr:hypothetical protein LTR77_008848 [Saxophila tyrrhenica]
MKAVVVAAAALGFAPTAYAEIVQSCPSSDVCYSLSIPDETASSGKGDIYFQLSCPTSNQYVALGQGSQMAGSNMFVMYTSADGTNVTVSPRIGTGNVMPLHDTSADIEVLEGSGVSNGIMTANVRCSNCDSWSGGSMDFSSSSATWIWAIKSGSSLDSDDLSENIGMHDSASSFTFDLSSAAGGSADVNPFASGSNATTTSKSGSGTIPATCTPITSTSSTACPTQWPPNSADGPPASRPTWPASCFPGGGHRWRGSGPPRENNKLKQKRDDGCPAGYEANSAASSYPGGGSSNWNTLVLAHGVLACLAFVALFPIGGILIRVANFTGLIWVHAALQILAFAIYIAAFGMGVYLAMQARLIGSTHPIIGIVLLIILVGQPIFGWLHHKLFKKYGHRTLWSYLHLWHGRAAILLGMVNGGLGLALARAGRSAVIAYSVVAGVVGVVYIAAAVMGEMRRKRRTPPSYEKSQREYRRDDVSSHESGRRREYYGPDERRGRW